jgi:haloacetate dehalogenase
VRKLCVIDIAPTFDMYGAHWGKSPGVTGQVADPYFAFAQAYYHWFHLTQPAPLPETMIGGNPKTYLHAKLGGWGSQGMGYIEPEALAEYERAFCNPALNSQGWSAAIHSAAEDYRASAGIDLQHDQDSRKRGDKIACDTLVLWGERGVVNRMFAPVDLWQAQCAGHVQGLLMAAGHFIPEELPQATSDTLAAWMV